MVKFFFCLFITGLIASCSYPKPSNDPMPIDGDFFFTINLNSSLLNEGSSNEWPENWPKEGFEQHSSHKYGLDASPNFPYVSGKTIYKEDSVVYISVLKNDVGYATVYTDSGLEINYDYYYCNPDNKGRLSSLPEIAAKESKMHTYEVTPSSREKIALCKNKGGNEEKIQELHKKIYDWENYEFDTYIFGNENGKEAQSLLIRSDTFWSAFNEVYKQAVVRMGSLTGKISSPKIIEKEDPDDPNSYERISNRGYILTRVRGEYEDQCVKGDIDRVIDEIVSEVENGGNRRAIIQLGYPTKRFWPLKAENDSIKICGEPDEYATSRNSLMLVPIKDDCWTKEATVTWSNGIWKLKYNNGVEDTANVNNINPNCVVFAESGQSYLGSQYVGEMSYDGLRGEAKVRGKAIVVILPWQEDAATTARVAYHELGHTMGLIDINDSYLSSLIGNKSEQGNLMHHNSTKADPKLGYKLRYRGMVPSDNDWRSNPFCENKANDCGTFPQDCNCVELQWDCLRKDSGKKKSACISPNIDPYYSP